jgi:hypothetical protein
MGIYHPRPRRRIYSSEAVKVLAALNRGPMSQGELFVATKLQWSVVLSALSELMGRGLVLQFQSGSYYVNHFDSHKVVPQTNPATAGNPTR